MPFTKQTPKPVKLSPFELPERFLKRFSAKEGRVDHLTIPILYCLIMHAKTAQIQNLFLLKYSEKEGNLYNVLAEENPAVSRY